MLKELDLNTGMPKAEYRALMEGLEPRLAMLQQEIIREKIPVIILFEGLSAAGKGAVTNSLILNFDARGFTVYNTRSPEPSELRRPWLARFAEKAPPRGRMAIFDRAWYSALAELDSKEERKQRLREVNIFERQLADDGYLILKYFLYIDKKEQKKRLEALAQAKSTAWRVTKKDFKNLKHHAKITDFYDSLINETDKPFAPWHVVAATDRRYVRAAVFSSIVENLERALVEKRKESSETAFVPKINPRFRLLPHRTIWELDMEKKVGEEEYHERLREYQDKLFKLQNKLYLKKIPVIVAYEGNDAAGKGGNIRRVARALDARGYAVTPIAAPTPDELNHQYLWRFWRALPRTGHFAIFDRTWYGRVLVERVEGLTSPARVAQAYGEINEFESILTRWGAAIFKFWLAIDKDEQLRRFEDRQNTPEKRWKITEEDWRNRDKWEAYTQAVDDMFRYTNTDFAPWIAVESNCKRYARLKTLETMIETLQNRL